MTNKKLAICVCFTYVGYKLTSKNINMLWIVGWTIKI